MQEDARTRKKPKRRRAALAAALSRDALDCGLAVSKHSQQTVDCQVQQEIRN
jgi:hypothetical protein